MKKLIVFLVPALLSAGLYAQNFRGSANAMQSFMTESAEIVQTVKIHPQVAPVIPTEIVIVQVGTITDDHFAKEGSVIQEEIVAGVIQEELNAGRKTGPSNFIHSIADKIRGWFR